MRLAQSSFIYVYSVTFGPEVNCNDPSQTRETYRAMKADLSNLFNLYITTD